MKGINDDITFNALLDDIKIDDDSNVSLKIVFNLFIIPLISLILSSLFSWIMSFFTDYRDKLQDSFREEEIKMRAEKKYKVDIKRKIQIKKEIYEALKCLKIKIIIYFIIDFLFWLFSFYYLTLYCNILFVKQNSLIYQSFISVCESMTSNALFSLILAAFYKISLKYQSERLYKLTLFWI